MPASVGKHSWLAVGNAGSQSVRGLFFVCPIKCLHHLQIIMTFDNNIMNGYHWVLLKVMLIYWARERWYVWPKRRCLQGKGPYVLGFAISLTAVWLAHAFVIPSGRTLCIATWFHGFKSSSFVGSRGAREKFTVRTVHTADCLWF